MPEKSGTSKTLKQNNSMINYNHVTVMGILTRDPDIKTVGNAGMKLARLSVCINEKRKTQDGTVIANPVFIDVDAWARIADMCEKYLAKNSNIFVEGKLQMAQWEKDGVKHQKLKIRASNIKFLPKGNRLNANTKRGKDNIKAQEEQEPTAVLDTDAEVFVPDEGGDDGFSAEMSKW